MLRTVAALYVQTNGAYYGVAGVDPWDEARDATRYLGPHPVVAHPPCASWCRLAGLREARWGLKAGDDGGTFAAALRDVRKHGGLLEQPAFSKAFAAYGLPIPRSNGLWYRGDCGGYSAYVEQYAFGHVVRKATWLYAYGCELPALPVPAIGVQSRFTYCKNRKGFGSAYDDKRPRLGKRAASATPAAFRDLLISMARSVSWGLM